MPLVFFERQGKTIRTNAGVNLRQLARKHDIEVYHGVDKLFNCRGQGLCGTCKVEIVGASQNEVNPRTSMEEQKLKNFNNPQLRLSCQVQVHGSICVKTYPVDLSLVDEGMVAPPMGV